MGSRLKGVRGLYPMLISIEVYTHISELSHRRCNSPSGLWPFDFEPLPLKPKKIGSQTAKWVAFFVLASLTATMRIDHELTGARATRLVNPFQWWSSSYHIQLNSRGCQWPESRNARPSVIVTGNSVNHDAVAESRIPPMSPGKT